MSEQLHDDTFAPFTITDGRCVVAPESEWSHIERAATAGRRIAVGDVFSEWDGLVYYSDGDVVAISGLIQSGTANIRRRTFAMFDRTAATWCIETRYPENVLTMIPDGHWRKLPCPKHLKQFQLECPACNGKNAERVDKQRPNVHIYAGPIHTQADADAMIPHLLRCPAAVRGLVVTPRERISLAHAFDLAWGGEPGYVKNLRHVIIRGGDKPLHPEHVRGIIAQCEAAGVPCWLEWGEWVLNKHKTHGKMFGPAGSLSGPWVTACSTDRKSIGDRKYHAYPANATDDFGEYETLSRVGRARSGSMLDGKEWRQLPEVTG
jgi:hypothetical protein